MSDVIKDVLMGKLFGTSGTSSGGGSSGGGGTSSGVSPKEVNFYDYDGTCVHAYTVAEAQKLSELPAGPEHPGLVFQGWNWSLEGVKGLTRAMNIGAMYTTDDGTTRLYITLQEGRTSPMLGVGVNGTVTVDWGDGTEPDVLTGTSTSTTVWTENHAYAAPGDYVIRLTVDGEMAVTGDGNTNGNSRILRYASDVDARNSLYQRALRRVEIGDNVVSLKDYAFYQCANVDALTISKDVKLIGKSYVFPPAYGHLTIPNGITEIQKYAMYNGRFKSVSIPNSVIKLGENALNCACVQARYTIPDSVTDFGEDIFYNCQALASIYFPKNMTSVPAYTFRNCYGLAFIDFTACTVIPTLSATNAFSGVPADCEIRVPAALYDEWIAATNWATYASQIKAY